MRDLTFIEILGLVRRWWWVFILCPLLAGGAAYGVSRALTPIYRAQATLVIDQRQLAGSLNVGDIQAAQELAATYSRLVTARPILERTIADLGLDTTPEDLAEQVGVSRIESTQLVQIAVEDPVPSEAARIANTLARVFIEETRAQQDAAAGSGRDELRRHADAVLQRIDAASDRIAELQLREDAGSASVQAELRTLQTQLSQDQALYASLLEAQQRMDLAAAQSTTQIRVVERAVPPTESIKPRVLLNAALAGVLGIVLAAGLVLVVGYLDNTVKTSEDVERLTGRGALGLIPELRSPESVEAIAHPDSIGSEAFRTARTNLEFAAVGRSLRSIVVTSSRPGDGKTTTAVNLAAVLAQGGKRVVLVDADLRRPQVHRHFAGLSTRSGLTNLLLSDRDVSLHPVLRQTTVFGLSVLPAGPVPPNPLDLLSSPRMQEVMEWLASEADIVIIDAPPLAVSDALVLSRLASGMVLITQSGRVRPDEFAQVLRQIERAGTALLGVILNRFPLEKSRSYYAYYRGYGDGQGEDDEEGIGEQGGGAFARANGRPGVAPAARPPGSGTFDTGQRVLRPSLGQTGEPKL